MICAAGGRHATRRGAHDILWRRGSASLEGVQGGVPELQPRHRFPFPGPHPPTHPHTPHPTGPSGPQNLFDSECMVDEGSLESRELTVSEVNQQLDLLVANAGERLW